MKRVDVLRTLARHRARLAADYGVDTMSVFGSVAHDEATPASDVDLLVSFDRPTGLFGLLRLQADLEDVLGCEVDLGTPGSLKPALRDRVLQEAVNVPETVD